MLPENITILRDLSYVKNGHERQKLDLYLPQKTDPTPLIIWIHGGGYRRGSKDIGDIPLPYLKHGFALASINYQLSQHALFPAQLQDCKSAIRWLRAHAKDYNLDTDCFVVWGNSAGGHLAALLGTTGHTRRFDIGSHLAFSSQVQAVIDYFGPTDFLQMDTHRLPNGLHNDLPDSPGSLLIGGPIQEHPEKVALANPVQYVTAKATPFLIVHGKQDPIVPYHQSLLLYDALTAAGVDVTFYTVEHGQHGHFTDPQVSIITEAFVKQILAKP